MKKRIVLSYIILLIMLPALISTSTAQTPNPQTARRITDRLISLVIKNETLDQVIQRIHIQEKINFAYDPQILGLSRYRLSPANYKSVKLGTVLDQLFSNTQITYDDTGAAIILFEKSKNKPVPVTGRVTESVSGESMPGVSVQLKNAGKATATDKEGYYTISAALNDTLVFSSIGYLSQEVRVTRPAVSVMMKPDQKLLSNVVVIGYGTQQKDKVTGSIGQVKGEAFQDEQISSVEQGIAAKVPGVQVIQASGTPGGGVTIKIRGTNSITAGTQPLFVVDGFPLTDGTTTSLLNPNDVESVEVLKDAASAAIYGSRGSNGVILITTKKAGSGKSKIQASAYFGIQNVAKLLDLMDAYQYAQFVAAGRNNAWIDLNPAKNKASDPNSVRTNSTKIPDYLLPYLNGQPGLTNTNWQKALFRNAPVREYNVSASGSSKSGLNSFISATYLNQDGVILNSGFNRLTFRSNLEYKISPKVTLNVNLTPSYSTYKAISEDTHKKDGVVLLTTIASPAIPVYNADGSLALGAQITQGLAAGTAVIESPVATALLITDNSERIRFLGNASLKIDLAKGLSFKSYFGTDLNSYRENYFRPSILGNYGVKAPTQATGRSQTSRVLNWINENTLDYATTIAGKHHITALIGYTLQKEDQQNNQLTAANFPDDNIQTLNAGTITGGSSTEQQWSLISYLSRITYDYTNTYLLTASIRRDGSSRFGKNSQWGYFPSVSAGWRLSNESFFPKNNIVNDVKIRGSYGMTGNFQIPNYGAYSLLSVTNYPLNGTVSSGQSASTSPNPDISWEKTSQFNVGVDMSLIKNHLQFTAEYYDSRTKGLLLNVPVPASSGFSTSLQNLGSVKNSGLEFALSSSNHFGKLNWTSSFNISTNKNKVLALGPGQTQILSDIHITQVGQPIGAYYGYQVLGVYKNQADLAQYPHLSTAKVGTYIYADLNNDDKITDADRKPLGKYFPDYTFGFTNTLSYHGFDLNVVIQGVEGYQIFNIAKNFSLNAEGWGNGAVALYNGYFKSESDPGAGYARPNPSTSDKLYEKSNYMIEDASFIRFRNITFGYSLPDRWMSHIKAVKARLYVSAQNPFTITKYTGYNPEVSSSTYNSPITPGVDYGAYPAYRSFIVGLNLNF